VVDLEPVAYEKLDAEAQDSAGDAGSSPPETTGDAGMPPAPAGPAPDGGADAGMCGVRGDAGACNVHKDDEKLWCTNQAASPLHGQPNAA
jgi:hypothetical protein